MSGESTELDESAESHEMFPKTRPLIGANNKCTYGPSYWCSSNKAMKECNVCIIERLRVKVTKKNFESKNIPNAYKTPCYLHVNVFS